MKSVDRVRLYERRPRARRSSTGVPAGLGRDGLPVGMQIMVDRFRESEMFRIAYAHEQAQPVAPVADPRRA